MELYAAGNRAGGGDSDSSDDGRSGGGRRGFSKLTALSVFVAGVFLGSGGLTARWMHGATVPDEEDDADARKRVRRERKALAARMSVSDVSCRGTIWRWDWASLPWLFPHWERTEAERVRESEAVHIDDEADDAEMC